MVLEELGVLGLAQDGIRGASLGVARGTGALVVEETTGRPYTDHQFRRKWRQAADAAGVPREVYNMDSRAGAITEATDSGAQLEDVRHAATHSNVSMTQRYSRGGAEKTAVTRCSLPTVDAVCA